MMTALEPEVAVGRESQPVEFPVAMVVKFGHVKFVFEEAREEKSPPEAH